MTVRNFVPVLLLFLGGCATYKQLKPVPLPQSAEKGYIELKRKEKNFKLKEGKQYFINFPPPGEDHFFLVFKISDKNKLEEYLTSKLEKKKRPGEKIKNQTHEPDSLSVYPVSGPEGGYFWIIEEVVEDVQIKLEYRYTPQWRFKFENRHASFKETLNRNRVRRDTYNAIGNNFSLEGFNFAPAIDSVTDHLGHIGKIHEELMAIESIFPATIRNSKDPAYQDFLKLKKDLEDEMAFQGRYLAVLRFFNAERTTRGNPAAFMGELDHFIQFFSQQGTFPEGVKGESRNLMKRRLGEILAYYDRRTAEKKDAEPFDNDVYLISGYLKLDSLYSLAGVPKSEAFKLQNRFIRDFIKKGRGLISSKSALLSALSEVKSDKEMPGDDFFTRPVARANSLVKALPKQMDESYGKYRSYPCTQKLNQSLFKLQQQAALQRRHFQEAGNLVREVNALKLDNDYRGMLGLLKDKKHLGFLLDKYTGLDRVSVDEQSRQISEALSKYRWGPAETGLATLHTDNNFLNPEKILPIRDENVRQLEDSLYINVDKFTRFRVDKFCEANVSVLDNIDSLYEDSVFLPAHDIRFSSGSKAGLIQRKNALVAHLARLKDYDFPAKAVKLTYRQFLKAPYKDGVRKARAVAAHGRHYKGNDRKVKRAVAECNPATAKWIVKPAVYRRVFALPLNENRRKQNTYKVRLSIKIPTEAKFPVFDVNIKLPKQVAGKAGARQWYEKILLNRNELKNEGRFSITAPTEDNGYECQITPVRMIKDKVNHLDLYFRHPAFAAFPISVMVQKPIIKKN